MNRTPHHVQGFTLIELLVVIAIIGVLAALLIPSYTGAQKKPYDAAALQCGRAIVTGQTAFKAETGSFSSSIGALGEDVREVCQNQGIQVHTHGAHVTDPATVGDSNFSVNGNDYAFQAWHPKGTGVYRYWKNGSLNHDRLNHMTRF